MFVKFGHVGILTNAEQRQRPAELSFGAAEQRLVDKPFVGDID